MAVSDRLGLRSNRGVGCVRIDTNAPFGVATFPIRHKHVSEVNTGAARQSPFCGVCVAIRRSARLSPASDMLGDLLPDRSQP